MKSICPSGEECRREECDQWNEVKKPGDRRCLLDEQLVIHLLNERSADQRVTTKYWLGDNVGSTLADDLDGIVIGVLINPGPSVSYNVAWINGGERKTDWFKECELRGVDQMEETIGSVSKKEEGEDE